MENKQPTEISYYAHEAEVARLERHNKRAFLFALIIFVALILTNVGWIIHESMYEDTVTETYTTSTDGENAIFVNGNGSLNYGANDLQENEDTK